MSGVNAALVLYGVLVVIGYFAYSHLKADIEELFDAREYDLLGGQEMAQFHSENHREAMKQIGLLRFQLDEMAKAHNLEWRPTKSVRIKGQYTTIGA